MRRGFATCSIADFRARVALRRHFGLRGPVEKFRSVEFDFIVGDAGRRLRRRDHGDSLRRAFGDIRATFFPFWSLDSWPGEARGGQSREPGICATIHAPERAISKHLFGTMTYDEYSITVACYLCNTHPKTVCRIPFRAVPLLRVHGASVIVILRRRGASRGRPVLGGSLKSLAFMRECPKARSG
jgi:hypothetical protein